MSDKINAILSAVKAKAGQRELTVAEYEAKSKIKALTQGERLDRIEKLLGIKK